MAFVFSAGILSRKDLLRFFRKKTGRPEISGSKTQTGYVRRGFFWKNGGNFPIMKAVPAGFKRELPFSEFYGMRHRVRCSLSLLIVVMENDYAFY